MTSNVSPISYAPNLIAVPPITMISVVVESDEPVVVATIPATPPPEVLQAVQTASQTYDKLLSLGQHVHFATDPRTGRLSIELVSLTGAARQTVTPHKLLELASGGSLHRYTKGH
jgi:hypothetical protein